MAARCQLDAGKLHDEGRTPDPDRILPACVPSAIAGAADRRFEMEWTKVEGGLERLDRLFSMADRETRAITACARALRLTPQSQIDPAKAGRAINNILEGPRPWD